MRGGDDDAGVGAQTARDVGDAGRGQRPDEQNIHAHGEDAGRDGVFEHVTGEARVLAEDDFVPATVPRLRRDVLENVAGGATQPEGSLGGYRFDISRSPDTVGAEDFLRLAHGSIPILLTVG